LRHFERTLQASSKDQLLFKGDHMENAERIVLSHTTPRFTLAPYFGIGFLVWLVATVLMRLDGQYFFRPDNAALMLFNFIAMLIAMPLLALAIFRWRRVPASQRAVVALAVAVPGMLLDVLTTYFFVQVFPNVSATGAGAWGAWLLFSYALFLLPALKGGKDE
jgi:hypothetical protein